MAYGVLFETDNFITNCVNRGGVSAIAIDGGAPIVEGLPNSTDKELYNLTAYATGGKRVAIAFNPSVKYDANGLPAQRVDDRLYTNEIGSVVDYFVPEVGIEFGVIANNIGTGTGAIGKFLEPTNGTTKWTVSATQTASVPSFEIIDTRTVYYPTLKFTDDAVTVFIVKTRYNG